ncbi:MAG: AMP-binding protein [Thermomicrobiales bacterium]
MDSNDHILARIQEWTAIYGGPPAAVADLLCDRHATQPDRLAARFEDAAGREVSLAFAELRDRSARFARVLRDLGVDKGDRVATLLPKTPELLIATLALWRLGAVHVPLFTAFGPQAIAYRVDHSGARVLVTDAANRPKLAEFGDPALRVVAVEGSEGIGGWAGDIPFWQALEAAAPVESPVTYGGDDPMILIYTSGTTGHPKGVPVPVKALAAIETYMRFGLDVRPDDVFWNIADPGWAYGLYYALVGPLLLGQAMLLYNAPFSAEATYQIWRKFGVTNFAAAPTVYRALRAAGVPAGANEWLRLRVASSAGEPLNPEVIAWAAKALAVPLHDQYGQTEHGMMVINHHHSSLCRPQRPGSMGHPMPGFRVVIVDGAGNELGPNEEGQIAIDVSQSPLYWFPGYYREPEWTARSYVADGRYYVSGDAASQDNDGYVTFAGRADDLISSAGYRIGPFEVESALVGHPAVAEAAVVGKPDSLRGEVVKAFVVLKPGINPSDELADELGLFVKTQLAAYAYPREVAFVDQLPKTPSGKIQRFLLRAGETAKAPGQPGR